MASGERLFVAQHKPCREYTRTESNHRANTRRFTYTSKVSYNLELWTMNYVQKSVISD
jgi:hypothetical protein